MFQNKNFHKSINPDALYDKSRSLINRALMTKEDPYQYQLWSSLALEILGKTYLAKIHPSLIIDPNNEGSLLAASKLNIKTAIRTITWKVLFGRISKVDIKFDDSAKEFCERLAERRNAELHSGETPFNNILLQKEEGRYWNVAQHILQNMGKGLDDWLGVKNAKDKNEIVKRYKEVLYTSTQVKIADAKSFFNKLNVQERTYLKSKDVSDNRASFAVPFKVDYYDLKWEVECPVCKANGFMAGMEYDVIILEKKDEEEPWLEYVEQHFLGEVYRCLVCGLYFNSIDEIELANLQTEHSETHQRDPEYYEWLHDV